MSSPSHLSLLFAKTFNISIPLQHIPQDLYKFEHTDEQDDSDSEAESDDGGVEEVGRWRNTKTGLLVGEEGKKGIKFTVIGLVERMLLVDFADKQNASEQQRSQSDRFIA